MTLKIELLDSRKHDRSKFSCGKDSLDTYILKQASQDLKRRVSTPFVLIDAPEVELLAYYTISAYTVDVTALDASLAKRLPRYPVLPATLLGRLAVSEDQKGKGFGELMLLNALRRSLEVSANVASLAVVAEAIDQNAVSFYIKYGFRPFRHNPMKLYLPMKSIEVLCQNFDINV